MCATRMKHASTWRAILAGCKVLQHGLIKRVVDGESTDIWGDRWILDHFGARPITPREDRHPALVSQLLLDNGLWDEALILDRFFPIDAEAILRQLRGRAQSDFWAWEPEKFGVYTVRSAYKLVFTRKSEALFVQQPSSSDDGPWKKIWKLEIPPKVGDECHMNFCQRDRSYAGDMWNR